jgi:hypothetical protein
MRGEEGVGKVLLHWKCSVCGVENHGCRGVCGVCLTQLPLAKLRLGTLLHRRRHYTASGARKAIDIVPLSSDGMSRCWTCAACGFGRNFAFDTHCRVCTKLQPSSELGDTEAKAMYERETQDFRSTFAQATRGLVTPRRVSVSFSSVGGWW